MQTKRPTWMFLSCWLVFILACQFTSSTPVIPLITTTVEPFPIVTIPPTAIPQTPEYPPFIPVDIVHAGVPPKQGDAKVSLPEIPGDYLVYRTKRGSLQYVSLDGTLRGNLIDGYLISELEPVLKTEGLDPVRMISNGEDSRFIFVQERDDKNYGFESASIWVTDLFGNPIKSWEVPPDPNLMCLKSAFSPLNQWILMDCEVGHIDDGLFYPDNHQLHLINAESGIVTIVNVTKCRGGEFFFPQQIIWSQDEEQFLYWCNYNEYALISTKDSEPNYIQMLTYGSNAGVRDSYILSVSPDWKKIVLDMGGMPKNADGTVSGYRILVADLECVLNNPNCSGGETFTLSFAEPRDEPSQFTDIHIYWVKEWGDIVWVVSPGITASGAASCIDLSTNTNQECPRDWAGQEFLGTSPDGHWLLFDGFMSHPLFPDSFSRFLYVVSVKDNTIRYLTKPDENNMIEYIGFYGWLTVP